MAKKILKIFGMALVALVLVYAGWTVYLKVQIDRGNLIKWDNKFYTKQELKEKFPPQEYSVEAKNTPEQVYAEFRQALLNNDIEGALGLIREETKTKYVKEFADQKILEKYKKMPDVQEIKKSEKESVDNYANYYYFLNDNEIPFQIEFIKNSDGYWQIDQI
ncbi:MAG: hypothetical protein Q8O93_03745 [bacterium]|nr:hypothetical protein [bacterium]